ncbi:NifR3/Smm1 family protein [Catenovulum agarivorans DS-2]|uniref:tRNA-dihydrouridine(16) synthase n=1 Tax=Catenovulum agarivorans DS-2 TaxID=1328313 RepID=W7QDB4_9ALTE|nr:tRNA-dihydrouridine synthase [Catenovulum agarivorans]EWH10894.1 NifR3/Smm1 family protein [Catenovulum agarivorans DS-2]
MLSKIKSLTLAPMEGVVDFAVRDLLTRFSGFDLCVTEFLRVSQTLLPERSFYRLCPELQTNQGKTPSGVPVRVQLLGNNPDYLAENAVRAIELGSHGVDLNFGCPAKTVNNSKGGAVLLQEPEVLYEIVKAVRNAVPQPHVVSAKIRLGFDDARLFHANVDAVNQAGASSLAVHARTKAHGYKPPAYWFEISRIIDKVDMPVIANGEVWSVADAENCLSQSGCQHLMVGRGALAMPNIASVLRHNAVQLTWLEAIEVLIAYADLEIDHDKGLYYGNRVKQWLRYLKIHFPQASDLLLSIRKLHDKNQVLQHLTSLH